MSNSAKHLKTQTKPTEPETEATMSVEEGEKANAAMPKLNNQRR